MRWRCRAPLLLLLALLPAGGLAGEFVGPEEAETELVAENVSAHAGTVRGRLHNRGAHEVRDVRLLVQLVYRWPDEYHPGAVNPSRAVLVGVPGPIPPGEAAPFRVELSATPDVAAGPPGSGFEVRAAVMGWTEALPPARR